MIGHEYILYLRNDHYISGGNTMSVLRKKITEDFTCVHNAFMAAVFGMQIVLSIAFFCSRLSMAHRVTDKG